MGQEAPSTLAATVRRRIREIRVERGLTQAQLCERAGISVDAVTRIENGRRQPELRTIELLAVALGVAPSAFFEGVTPPSARTAVKPIAMRRIVAQLETLPADTLALADGVLTGLVRAMRQNKAQAAERRAARKRRAR
jgi:transcriptional regulator with XRE-family HTH domain